MRVHHDPASAALVRHQLREDLQRSGISDSIVDEVILVASELVGNAVLHTPDAGECHLLEVSWSLDASGVTLGVIDAGRDVPLLQTPASDQPSGRGMQIVEALCDGWGVTPHAVGKQVWAHIPIPARGLATG